MALQKVFKPEYIQFLKNNIKVENYLGDSFDYDISQVRSLAQVVAPVDLLDELVPTPKGDFVSAKAIYTAYKSISPVFAQQDNLWIYLTHVDLYDYVKKRWPIPTGDEEKAIIHIQNHWFRNQRFLRTTFAGLWWNVYLTIDEERSNPYELTEVMFAAGQDFRTLRFVELPLIRLKPAMMGVLEFLLENPDLINNFDGRGQYISRYFNMLGGFKQLSAMDKEFFKDTLYRLLPKLKEIKSISDVQNKEISEY